MYKQGRNRLIDTETKLRAARLEEAVRLGLGKKIKRLKITYW